MSVDVVGSTAYKSRPARQVQAWLPFFANFYREFTSLLIGRAEQALDGAQVELWKSLGDELVFYCELKQRSDAQTLLDTFVQCLADFRRRIRSKKRDSGLDLKGTAWTAGFPVVNAIIESSSQQRVDFIGPCIDIGFRLGKLASPDRIYVSAELAYMLTFGISDLFRLRFESTTQFKGVLNNKPYPLISLEFEGGGLRRVSALESKLRAQSITNDLKAYCREFVENSKALLLPFIAGDPNFNQRPSGFDKKIEAVRRLRCDMGEEPLPASRVTRSGKAKAAPSNLLTEVRAFKLKET